MIYRILVVLSALILSACTNGYQQFYEPGQPNRLLVLSKEEPVVLPSSGDTTRDFDRMYEGGYGLVGHAYFVGALADQKGAVAQAKKVGANRVIIGTKYRNTTSGVMPITTPTTTTAYTSGSITPRGYGYSGGSASYSGTTTIYGSETTYVPYSVDHYNQYALYFAPMERRGVGMSLNEPNNDVKRLAGTNKGHLVMSVRRGSPAFRADIMAGDLIITIADHDLVERADYTRAIAANSGREIDVVLYRGATRLTKRLAVPMPNETW